MIELVSAIAGLGAIVLIVGAIAGDALALRAWLETPYAQPPTPMWRGWYTVGIAVLVALWLATALLR